MKNMIAKTLLGVLLIASAAQLSADDASHSENGGVIAAHYLTAAGTGAFAGCCANKLGTLVARGVVTMAEMPGPDANKLYWATKLTTMFLANYATSKYVSSVIENTSDENYGKLTTRTALMASIICLASEMNSQATANLLRDAVTAGHAAGAATAARADAVAAARAAVASFAAGSR